MTKEFVKMASKVMDSYDTFRETSEKKGIGRGIWEGVKSFIGKGDDKNKK